MDNLDLDSNSASNVISLPLSVSPPKPAKVSTPLYDKIKSAGQELDALSTFKSDFDYQVYRNMEVRYADKPIRGGNTIKTAFRLVNSHSTCQQCLYSFEIDTYGRGCIHDCVYCYAKAQLSVYGYWNNPIPVPIDISEVRKVFYTVFETDRPNKWREILEKRVPLRIGSMSDSFMWVDEKYGVTLELLKILKHYKYPNIIFTRSDLIAEDKYLNAIDRDLTSIQFSMSSTNDKMSRKIEPGAPSPSDRLAALKKINDRGFWTTVRINPLFPIYPDGYLSDPNFAWKGEVPKFEYTSFDMVDRIAEAGTTAVLAGFVRLSSSAINAITKASGVDLRQFYRTDIERKSTRDFHYSDQEIRAYYQQFKQQCVKNAVEFTTCYIGNGEDHFWKDQDLWSNKSDCCNAKGKVAAFKTDARKIPFETRLKYTTKKEIPAGDIGRDLEI